MRIRSGSFLARCLQGRFFAVIRGFSNIVLGQHSPDILYICAICAAISHTRRGWPTSCSAHTTRTLLVRGTNTQTHFQRSSAAAVRTRRMPDVIDSGDAEAEVQQSSPLTESPAPSSPAPSPSPRPENPTSTAADSHEQRGGGVQAATRRSEQ